MPLLRYMIHIIERCFLSYLLSSEIAPYKVHRVYIKLILPFSLFLLGSFFPLAQKALRNVLCSDFLNYLVFMLPRSNLVDSVLVMVDCVRLA